MRVFSLLALVLAVALPVRAQGAAPPAEAAKPADAPAETAKPADAAPPPAEAPKPGDAATLPAEAPKPADATTGLLSLTSTPAGKVFLDGVDTGLTTPVTDLAVAAGKHTVKIVSEDGRSESTEFTMEAGGSLSLNLNLPEAKPAEPKPEDKPAEAKPAEGVAPAAPAAPPADDWTWMTVSGWAGLGLGTIGLLSGAVVLTTPTDSDQFTLGFGLFGGGVGLVLGGAVLLYLDNELMEAGAAAAEQKKDEPATAPSK